MTIIKLISEHIEDETEDAVTYGKMAVEYKDTYPELAAVFDKLSHDESHHAELLHEQVVGFIKKHRETNGEPPASMMAVYDHLHKKDIERMGEAKRYWEMFRN